MQDKEEERSLVNVENKLTKEGYTHDFKVTGRPPAHPRPQLNRSLHRRRGDHRGLLPL
ncbi:MAG: hypothetical protein WKG07_24055 [Hymenobacter sp.]